MTAPILDFITTPESKPRLRWYGVWCEPRQETKVGVRIARLKGARVFMPYAYREEKQGKWLVAVQDGLLFPGYIFVAMRAKGLCGMVSEVDGVICVMCHRNRYGEPIPTPIPYAVMRKIRTEHVAGERKRAAERFLPGQKVKITGGPFSGFDGIFDKPEKERLSILISLFGSVRPVPVIEDDVRAA